MKSNTYEPFITPTEKFCKMTPEERQAFIQSIPMQDKEFPLLSKGHSYPEKNFITLEGEENGKVIRLVTYRYKSQTELIKGVVVVLHSHYVHTQYTAHLAKRLSEEGYEVVAYDMRGHGQSQGQRGQWNDYKGIIKEAYTFMKQIQQLYNGIPMFALGWGAPALNILYIALYYYQEFKIAGMIMASALYKIPVEGKNFQVVGNVSQGYLKIEPATVGVYKPNYNYYTKYKNISKSLEQDPLNSHTETSVISVLEFDAHLGDLPYEHWDKMDTPPIVILHGQCDKHGAGYSAYVFYKAIKSQDKELWYYPKMNFAFLLEDQYPEIEERMVKWLNRLTQQEQN